MSTTITTMYSFKLCFNSSACRQMRRLPGSTTEVSSYAKLVELCHSMYPKIAQYWTKVLIKYVDDEGDEISADNEESFRGIHDYCKATVGNSVFCLKLTIDFCMAEEDAASLLQCDSPADSDQYVKVENPISEAPDQTIIAPASAAVDQITAAAANINYVPTIVTSAPSATTAISKQEALPSSAVATTESSNQQASDATVAGAATECRTCGIPTSNKCEACKTEYFCSVDCTRRNNIHTLHGCRERCINHWKASGIVFPLPGVMSIGTFVKARSKTMFFYPGFIAGYNSTTQKYSVKFYDGYFSDGIEAGEIKLSEPVNQETLSSTAGATTASAASNKEQIQEKPSVASSVIKEQVQETIVASAAHLAIGKRVTARFRGDLWFYPGCIAAFNPATQEYRVNYDNGCVGDYLKACDIIELPAKQETVPTTAVVTPASAAILSIGTLVKARTWKGGDFYNGCIAGFNAAAQDYRVKFEDGNLDAHVKACDIIELPPKQAPTTTVAAVASAPIKEPVNETIVASAASLAIGRLVKVRTCASGFRFNGTIAAFNPTTQEYSVKFDDGYLDDHVKACNVIGLLSAKQETPPSIAVANVASAAMKEQIKEKETTVVSAATKEQVQEKTTVASAAILAIGTLVKARRFASDLSFHPGCIVAFNSATQEYSVKYDDGCVYYYVKACNIIELPAKQETAPSTAVTTVATATASKEPVKEATVASAAARKEENTTAASAARCLKCGVQTSKKCDACKTAYFCSTYCARRHKTHTESECRDNCISHWKALGRVVSSPHIAIGTLVMASLQSGLWDKGFISDYDAATQEYSVKYYDGYFYDCVKALDIKLLPPTKEVAPASIVEATTVKQEAGATVSPAIKEEIKDTKCQTCIRSTSNKCPACKSVYFCSTKCAKASTSHNASECRDNCINYWKASGIEVHLPARLAIGTLVCAQFQRSHTFYPGFVAGFNPVNKAYSVKFDDGDFDDYVRELELGPRKVAQPKSPGVWGGAKLTPEATTIVKEIFHRYSETGLVEVVLEDLVVSKQTIRCMSLTNFKLFLSDFLVERNPGPSRLKDFYYKYATGIASNDVAALVEDGFIKYYTEQARLCKPQVWYDIFSMGYDANLKKVSNNEIRKGEVVLYRPSLDSDFEDAVVLNVVVSDDQTTEFHHILLLKSGIEMTVPKGHKAVRKCYDKCHKCRATLKKVSLHSFCCCANCEEVQADGSPIQSISI